MDIKIGLPAEFRRNVVVQEEMGVIKVTIGDGDTKCFVGSNRHEHAEVALHLMIEMIEKMKYDNVTDSRVKSFFSINKKPNLKLVVK